MTTSHRIFKNSIFLLSSNVISKIINLAILLILTRLLGKEGFGLYSFAFAYVSIFIFFVHLGIPTLLIREIAKNKTDAENLISTTLPLILIFSIFTFLLINLSAYIFSWSQIERVTILIFSFYLVFDTISRYLTAVFRAYERMEYEAIINVTERIALLIIAILIWYLKQDLILLLISFSSIELLKAFTVSILIRKHFFKFKLNKITSRALSLLKQAIPFALIGLFGTISTKIDTIMLNYFHDQEVVGLFNAAKKLIESLSFIPESIAYALFPALSVLYISQREDFRKTFQLAFEYLLILAIPLSAGIFFMAPKIIQLFYEPEFSESSVALKWLAIWLGLLFLKYVFATTLNSIGKQSFLAFIIGITMILNISLNYLLIPEFDILGASLASVFSELGTAILTFIFLIRFTNLSINTIALFKLIFAGLVLIVFLNFIQNLNLFLVLFLTAGLYIFLLFVFKIVSSKDINYLKQLIKKTLNTSV